MDWLTGLLLSERWPTGATLQETTWSFRAVPAYWLLFLVALLLIAASIWFYRREKLTSLARWVLIGCRVLIFSLLVLLICRPTLEATLQSNRPRPIVILVDNSLSMSLNDPRTQAVDRLRVALAAQLLPPQFNIQPTASLSQVPEQTPENLTRADLVRLLLAHPEIQLLQRLEKQGPLQIKLFGQGITGTQLTRRSDGSTSIEGFTATETKSTLGDAIQSLLAAETDADRPAAIIVLTDGLEHDSTIAPEQVAQRCQQLKIPLHLIGIGSSDWAHVQIKSLSVPEALFIEDTVSAQLTWRAQGLKSAPLTITLTLGDTVVARKELAGRNGEQITEIIPFAVPKTLLTDGPIDLRVVMSGPALEDSPINQVEWSQRVRLIDRQVRVLLIDQSPRFETKFLMSTLLRDRRVEAHFHFTANNPEGMQKTPFEANLPATRAELFHYDLIVLGDVNPEIWGQDKLLWLRDLVREGAGLVLISGRKHAPAGYMKTALAEVIPVEGPDSLPPLDETLKTEAYQPELTAVGSRHEMLALADDPEENTRLWTEFPGFHGAYPAVKLRPGAVSLLQHPTKKAGDKQLPLLALQRYGRGQVLYLGTDETWRWRANGGEKLFVRFWGQVIYQLGLPRVLGGARRVQFSFDRTEHHVGQPSFLYARAYDQEFQLLTDARLPARLVPLDRTGKPSGEAVIPMSLEAIPGQPGDYRTLLGNDKPGRFLLMMDAPEPSQIPFHVDYPPNDERIPAPMAADRLKQLANASSGTFSREENLMVLPDKVKPQEGLFRYRRDVVLWNPLALILIAGLFAVEWIIRKLTNLS